MGLIKFSSVFIIIITGVIVTSQCQIEPYKNKILFENKVNEVLDSISRMEQLMKKFPKTGMVNYYLDQDGYLYLNSARIARIQGAIDNPKVRRDMVFEKFTQSEIDEFFYLMAYLMRNHVSSCNEDKRIGKFLFEYRSRDVKSDDDLREIMVVSQSADTLNANFKKAYRILDKKGNTVLLISAKANIK